MRPRHRAQAGDQDPRVGAGRHDPVLVESVGQRTFSRRSAGGSTPAEPDGGRQRLADAADQRDVPVIQALHAADGGTAGTQPMKIPVAGGSGALGRRVVPLLKRRSHHVDAPTRRGVGVPGPRPGRHRADRRARRGDPPRRRRRPRHTPERRVPHRHPGSAYRRDRRTRQRVTASLVAAAEASGCAALTRRVPARLHASRRGR